MKTNTKDEGALLRTLTLTDAVGIGLGAIIGAGIFVVTGVAAEVAGPAFLVGLLLAGGVAAFNGLSSAQLAAVYPQSGGTYEYGYRLLSPATGFAAGWMFLLSKLTAAGVVALGFGSYLHVFFPAIEAQWFAASATLLLTLANLFGIRKAGKLNLVIVSITLLALLYFVFAGLPEINTSNFVPFAPRGFAGISEAAALLFFAFTGYARIATLAEEVRKPEDTIPKAVIITIISALVLYVLVSVTAIGLAGASALGISRSPLQTAASFLEAPGIGMVLGIGACAAMLGVLLSQILGISRMMFAMGRRGDLPSAFSKVNTRYSVPITGILMTGIIILLLTAFGNFEYIVRTATFSILLYYSITNLAALRQPAQEQRFGRTVAVLGLSGCLAMAASLPYETILSGLGVLASGFLYRAICKKLSLQKS